MELNLGFSSSVGLGDPENPGQVYDVLVVGGGPAGLTAAMYAARAGLRTLVLDKSPAAGALGLTSHIENYPGVPGVLSGLELVQRFREQAKSLGAQIVDAQVLSAEVNGDPKEVLASTGTYRGKVLIVATGAMGRKQGLPGEERLVGRGVSYCATCDATFFKREEVAVVGDNDEAMQEALHLARFARVVHILAPTGRLKAAEELVERLQSQPNIRIQLSRRVLEVVGNQRVEGLRVAPRSGGEEFLPVKGAFIYLQGNRPIIDFLHGALRTTAEGCVQVDAEMQTSVPGVFAIGDVTCKRVRQAVIAAAEGAVAAMAAERLLSGRATLRSQW